MGFPINLFTRFISTAPLADAPGVSDMLALIQGGITKRLPIGSIPGLQPIVNAPTTIVTTNYPVLPADYYLSIRAAPATPLTITLPAGPGTGGILIIKDSLGYAAAGNIYLLNGNGKNIDGGTQFALNQPFQSVTLIYDGISWGVN